MLGKALKNILKILFSPRSYLWVILLISLIWVIIWIHEKKEMLNPNSTSIKIDWHTENIDKPLTSEQQKHLSDLKYRSEQLLKEYRQKSKGTSSFSLEKQPSEKEAKPSSNSKTFQELDVHQPIAYKNKKIKSSAIEKPKLSLVLQGVGLDEELSEKAASLLDPAITFSFIPYGRAVEKSMLNSQMKGHESLIAIPMESFHYPQDDSGSYTLLTGLSSQENRKRLNECLEKAKNCVGVCSYFGSRFTTAPQDLKPILQVIHQQGFVFLDTKAVSRSQVEPIANELNLPHASADVYVAMEDDHDTFIDKLGDLIEIATDEGKAVAVIELTPHRLEQLLEWQSSIEEDESFNLVPFTEIVEMKNFSEPSDSSPQSIIKAETSKVALASSAKENQG